MRDGPVASPSAKRRTLPPPRKKACRQCTKAKARCSLERPTCARCQSRSLLCEYGAALNLDSDQHVSSRTTPVVDLNAFDESTLAGSAGSSTLSPLAHGAIHNGKSENVLLPHFSGIEATFEAPSILPTSLARPLPAGKGPLPDFTNISLLCTVDPDRIRNRWLESFLPVHSQIAKNLQPGTIYFISSVFQTYPQLLLNNSTPNRHPIIHATQLDRGAIPTALANCVMLARMWENQVPGGEAIMQETVEREMKRLYEERQTYNQIDQLAAFQAYLLYTMMGFFNARTKETLANRDVMMNLQEFACDVAHTGLVCPAELCNTRPDWESWIVACSKRRTLFAMYMFQGIVNVARGLPHFLADELASLLAPSSRALWEAPTKEIWGKAYNTHLSEWPNGAFRIDELWPQPPESLEERQRRINRWLARVDEFGMMLFAVTSATHQNGSI